MESNVAFLCNDVSRLFRKRFTVLSRSTGATGTQWRVLLLLEREPGMTQAMLAEHMDVEPITACRMADRLEQAGLVERRKSASDRRVRQLYLTEAARPVVEELRAIGAHMLDRTTATLTPDEITLLQTLLTKVRDNIMKLNDEEIIPEAKNG